MSSDVLFEIKKENLETGLRGYPIGYCTTSTVDPTKGLFYSEKSIDEIAFREPEEVIYLLYYGKEGNKEEIQKFKKELERRSNCRPELIQKIKELPKEGHPMAAFSCALLFAGMYEGVNEYREDCLNLIAKTPIIVAHLITSREGWECKPSNPSIGYIENFTKMLNVPNANLKTLTDTFKLFSNLHFDHGGGNLSTFVGKAVASSLEDMYGSMSAAMCALAGPRHGKANQDCLEFNQEVLRDVGEDATDEAVKDLLKSRLEDNRLVFGFGHAVLRVEDPRATVIYEVLNKKFVDRPLVKIANKLRKNGPDILKGNPKIQDPYPNVDAVSGTLLLESGFPYPDYFTLIFGLARTVGIAIQIVYERCEAREGKGTPIIRPKYIYKKRDMK